MLLVTVLLLTFSLHCIVLEQFRVFWLIQTSRTTVKIRQTVTIRKYPVIDATNLLSSKDIYVQFVSTIPQWLGAVR